MAGYLSNGMILILDTTRSTELRVGLIDGRLTVLRRRYDYPASSQLLLLINELLHRVKKKIPAVTGIVVASGPGPFSALRTACALANAMSFALKIPAFGIRGTLTMRQLAEKGSMKLKSVKVGVPVVPFYGKPPNITRPRH